MTRRKRWLWQVILWGAYAAISLVVIGQSSKLTSGTVVIVTLLSMLLLLGSEALRAIVLRRGWIDLSGPQLAWRVIVLVLLLAMLIQFVGFVVIRSALALDLITLPKHNEYNFAMAVGYTINTAIILWLWLGCWLTAQYVRRARQAEIGKLRAEAAQHKLELDVLKAQINPHFIFNALNNLRAMINEDTEKAREMVTQLANIHRHTLYHSGADRVTVADELSVVKDYVALEKLHYEDCLQVEWRVEEGVLDATLPPMLLQLLVENAVKHGIAATVGGGTIGIAVARDGKCLRVSVGNPGRWDPGPDHGIGLRNLNERLVRASGDGAACRIESDGGGVRVIVDIPQ